MDTFGELWSLMPTKSTRKKKSKGPKERPSDSFSIELQQVWRILFVETTFLEDVLECRTLWNIKPHDHQGDSELFWLTSWDSELYRLGKARHFRYRVSTRAASEYPYAKAKTILGEVFDLEAPLTLEESGDSGKIYEHYPNLWKRTIDAILKKYGLHEPFRQRVSEYIVAGTDNAPIHAPRYTVTSDLNLILRGESRFLRNVLGEPLVTINLYGQISDADAKAAAHEANAMIGKSRYQSTQKRKDSKSVQEYVDTFVPQEGARDINGKSYSDLLYDKLAAQTPKGKDTDLPNREQEQAMIESIRKIKERGKKRASLLFPPDTYKS